MGSNKEAGNRGKAIMVQGTASSVGKSVLAAALCRIFYQDGYTTVPFKSQNMALNSFITEEGLEMGRAQVMQAEAAGIKPKAFMNPILLKPSTEQNAQVIIMGKAIGHHSAAAYQKMKPGLKEEIKRVFDEIRSQYDRVVIEGAGSPAEINLMAHDLVNMGMAEIADCPVLLVGDIDRGGVFASLYGTVMLLPPEQRRRIKGILINKFRGDIEILKPGLRQIEELTGIPVLGVLPYSPLNLEDEDSVTDRFTRKGPEEGQVNIDVIKLPYLSNFTDFHVFDIFPEVNIRYVTPGQKLDQADLVILPGSKSTMGDLTFLYESGLADEILRAYQRGAYIFGICGGFQMLGKQLCDPDEIEGSKKQMEGLGLLDIETIFEPEKITTQVLGEIDPDKMAFLNGPVQVKGYEIHMGRTTLGEQAEPLTSLTRRLGEPIAEKEGAADKNRRVFGTYLHGIFDEPDFTGQLIRFLMKRKGFLPQHEDRLSLEAYKEAEYEKLAALFRANVDMERIYQIMEGF